MQLSGQSSPLACTEPLVRSPQLHKPDVVTHTSNLSTWEVQTEGSEVHLNFQRHHEFKATLGYRSVLNKNISFIN